MNNYPCKIAKVERAAKTLLGHKSPDTTRIYIDQNRELADEIAGKIG